MAQEVEFGNAGHGKIRSFAVGFGLAIITLGIYYVFWYYLVNDELKDIGINGNDPKLAQSSPAMSVTAVTLGSLIFVPPLLSVYNYGQRIKRAQRLVGIDSARQISPMLAFLLVFPGSFFVIPVLFHYWYVTDHQNRALRAAGGLDPIHG
ncbi:MAG TPA: DUF4234 domain-containing protein [Solirubrobacteraceae bacterium]|jgi:hypothetical protein|nr:DUF4234 domain-containing protein [Solirubrobacteraceae bacterium]